MAEHHGLLVTSPGPVGTLELLVARSCWWLTRLIYRAFGTAPNRQARIAVLGGYVVALALGCYLAGPVGLVLNAVFGTFLARHRLDLLAELADIERRLPEITAADIRTIYDQRSERLLSTFIVALGLFVTALPPVDLRAVPYLVVWWFTFGWPLYAALWFGPPRPRLRDHAKAAARRLAELARAIRRPVPALGGV